MSPKPDKPNPRAEEAFAFFVSLPPERRQYAAVAEQFGVSLATVRLWGSKGNWRKRVLGKEIDLVRRTADRVQAGEIDTRTRHGKLVELGLIKLANAIARGEVKPTYGDLDRLVRLEGALKGTDKTVPITEVHRVFELFQRLVGSGGNQSLQLGDLRLACGCFGGMGHGSPPGSNGGNRFGRASFVRRSEFPRSHASRSAAKKNPPRWAGMEKRKVPALKPKNPPQKAHLSGQVL